MRRTVYLWAVAFLAITPPRAAAQEFALSSADLADSLMLGMSMRRLAGEVLATYRDSNRTRFLDNRFRLEILTGRYVDALASIAELRRLRQDTTPPARALHVQYEIFAAAGNRARSGRPFEDAFAESFRERFARLDDRTAALAARAILVTPRTVANDLQQVMPDLRGGSTTVSLDAALRVLRVYTAVHSYRAFIGLPAALVAEDDARRYRIESNVAVGTRDNATVCAIVVRSRTSRGRLPALLQFTIYADSIASMREPLLAAAHGYVGVTGHSRGKACSSDKTVPYVYDGADAAALIAWIAAQPWSDGRVGMYGGSYSGFTAWAAAKHMPSALKAIMVGAPVAPGIDVPMEGNVFFNFLYPWPFYTTNNRWLDNLTYNDNRRWNRLNREWYVSGRPYRDLERIDGTSNPVFAEWLAHPSIDAYWQAMVPQEAEYGRITIPVLQTAGYFYGGPGAAIWYYLQHYKHNPRARHYLLIGPYDHPQAQRGVVSPLGDTTTFIAGYETEPVAHIDIVTRLRFQWFDWVLRGGQRPALLTDRVNYQVLGANTWQHAPTIAAMSTRRLRLYLNPARSGDRYSLTETAGAPDASITHTVNLADRSDVNVGLVGGIVDAAIDTTNGVTFVSDPMNRSVEVGGLLSGHLELIANTRDFDFTITLYELMPDGRYFQLPPYISRASYVGDVRARRLLTPNVVERLDFVNSVRLMSRRVSAGSRIVMVLSVPKNPRQQINYGTGKDVSDESVADATEPLVIRWRSGSYVDLPVR